MGGEPPPFVTAHLFILGTSGYAIAVYVAVCALISFVATFLACNALAGSADR